MNYMPKLTLCFTVLEEGVTPHYVFVIALK